MHSFTRIRRWQPSKQRRTAAVAKQPKGELVVVVGFNYDLLETKVAEQVRSSADRIRERVKKTGEEITFATAREIVAEAKKKRRPRRQKVVPADKLGLRLVKSLERYKERWNPKELSELARQLREFADALEKPASEGKKKAKD